MANIAGIDIGSVTISLVVIGDDRRVVSTEYRFHRGAVTKTLRSMLENVDIAGIGGVAATLSGPAVLKGVPRWDNQLAVMAAAREFHPRAGGILVVGGENFGLITFNEQGDYENFRTNTSCAAGTGSFLDQQARRLDMGNVEMLSASASRREGQVPRIATRCAVFAKTDLIHAQQEGYSVGQISDALCEGLAKNLIDALMLDQNLREPLLMAGGVSLNRAVVAHLGRLLKTDIVCGEHNHLFGAIGAALLYLQECSDPWPGHRNWEELLALEKRERTYNLPPLSSPGITRETNAVRSVISLGTGDERQAKIEVDIYAFLEGRGNVYLGIDIGSTSTKALVLGEDRRPLIGLYTATAGRPLAAVQALFAAIEGIAARRGCEFNFLGVGTTGSGRKFIGRIINADAVHDEITAHARAAYELDPDVDTIIEIGGQDAKFTTLKDGMVTSAVMNNVCAAGTGSFIEELAGRLGVPLSEYASRAMNVSAPVSSDRCTVFMERDINNYLAEGYAVEEILASILHSVCENYLSKVANEGAIGRRVCMQGATARNPALVAAFAQRLNRSIFVSPLCHLTGAFGAALLLAESGLRSSSFRGLALCRESITVSVEVCRLCLNNCKISRAAVGGGEIAYGFLCGRDDEVRPGGRNERSYDLLREREHVFHDDRPGNLRKPVRIGIPDALYLAEEMPLWKHFFATLGVTVVTGENCKGAVKTGKRVAGAEFCAPMAAMFGQVQYLADRCDYIFLPVYLEASDTGAEGYRHYCYYSQFASCLAGGAGNLNLKDRAIMPVMDHRSYQSLIELFSLLKPVLGAGYWEIYNAYQAARAFHLEGCQKLLNIYHRQRQAEGDMAVVLLGRPYSALNNQMNNLIPGILRNLGVPCFFQDMLPDIGDREEIAELLARIPWNYSAEILKGALFTARTEGLYPVYLTSFKCSPDSFTIDYFKRIMDRYAKPYLILELDEHESGVGYETRIEAALRTFRNHHRSPSLRLIPGSIPPLTLPSLTKIGNKTLLFPCFDPLCGKLLEAVLIREGIDARLVSLTEKTIRKGLRTNRGQCIPVNLIAQSYQDYIEDNCLDPEQTAVWSFDSRRVACNIRMYPQMIKMILESAGGGMEKVDVYVGNLSLSDISLSAPVEAYFAYLFGGMLRRIGCRVRPYETEKGMTDRVISEAMTICYNSILGGRRKDEELKKIIGLFQKIETRPEKRPKVAIFGDLYARDNDVFNQRLIHCVEEYGGEVVTTPMNEFAKLVATPYIRRWFMDGEIGSALYAKSMVAVVGQLEKNYCQTIREFIDDFALDGEIDYGRVYDHFRITSWHCGESVDNLIKIAALSGSRSDISLLVQVSPAFCAAGAITEAMIPRIEAWSGIPVLSLTYDGTGKNINRRIIPYIKFPRQAGRRAAPRAGQFP